MDDLRLTELEGKRANYEAKLSNVVEMISGRKLALGIMPDITPVMLVVPDVPVTYTVPWITISMGCYILADALHHLGVW